MKIFSPIIYSIFVLLSSFQSITPEIIDFKTTDDFSSFTLLIHGISETKGEIRVAVFNSEKSYNTKKKPEYAIVLAVEEETVTWTVSELPYGEYAIAVYHDKNTNGKLDSNFLGIPKEDYGFSNNARGRFGPASWNDAMFEVSTSTSSHEIEIK